MKPMRATTTTPPEWASERLREVIDASIRAGALVFYTPPMLTIVATRRSIVTPHPPEILVVDDYAGRPKPPYPMQASTELHQQYPFVGTAFAPLPPPDKPFQPRFSAEDSHVPSRIMAEELWRAPAFLEWSAANRLELRRWKQANHAAYKESGRRKVRQREARDRHDAAVIALREQLGRPLNHDERDRLFDEHLRAVNHDW